MFVQVLGKYSDDQFLLTGEGSDPAVVNCWLLSKNNYWLQLQFWWWVSDRQKVLVATLPLKAFVHGISNIWMPTVFSKKPTRQGPTHLATSILFLSHAPTQEAGKRQLEFLRGVVASATALKICCSVAFSGAHHSKQIVGEDLVDPVQLSMFTHTRNRKVGIYFLSSANTPKLVSSH